MNLFDKHFVCSQPYVLDHVDHRANEQQTSMFANINKPNGIVVHVRSFM